MQKELSPNEILIKKAQSYVDNLPNIEKPLITIDFDDVARFSPELADAFFEPEHHQEMFLAFNQFIQDKRIDAKIPYNINFLPPKLMEYNFISEITHELEGLPVKFCGYVDAIAGVMVKAISRFKCEACKRQNTIFKISYTCQFCHVKQLKENVQIEKSSMRDFTFNESYDYKQVSESMDCYVKVMKKAENNIFDIESMLGKKLDFMGIMELKQTMTKCYPIIKAIGVRDAKTYELTPEKVKDIDQFIQENQESMLDILRQNIFNDHVGDDWELRAMIMCAVGLYPKDIELADDKSLQMVFQWVGAVGIGKSHLMKRLCKYLENASNVGKDSSQAGITGGAEKNSQGQFIFKMGEISKCNNGVLFGDEIGQWSEELQNSLSEQMSEGTISFTKIIKSKQKIFLNYILSGNPASGIYDDHKTYFENLGGTQQINDRTTIQIISPAKDIEEDVFSEIMDFAVNRKSHKKDLDDNKITDIIKRIKEYSNPLFGTEEYNQAKETFSRIVHLKPNIKDGFDKSSKQRIKQFRVRAWESYFKSIKAVGRIKGHKKVTSSDVSDAWDILYYASYRNLIKDYGDVDIQATELKESISIREGTSKPTSIRKLAEYIDSECTKNKDGVSFQDLITQVVDEWNINETQLHKAIEMLKGNTGGEAQIFESPSGTFRKLM